MVTDRYEICRRDMEDRLRGQIDFTREVPDEEIQAMIDDLMLHNAHGYSLNLEERKRLAKEIFYDVRRLGILQELIDAEDVTEIMINGAGNIFYEKQGSLYRWEKHFESKEKLENIIQQIVNKCNRTVNEASPIVDARLENGSRVNIVLSPVALNGPVVTIRRFPENPITMGQLIAFDSISAEAAEFLKKLVIAGYNIFISGGTGSGKTTFLNALSHYIPSTERIITIEDSAELQIRGISNLVSLETRNANTEGVKEISIRDLIKTSLRMRPDRIIVGEVRGAEAIDMLQALNTGHDGSLSTGHANSAKDMLARLETMVLMGMELPLAAVRGQIASGVDIIVHLGRIRDRSRKVLEIAEIMGYENGEIQTQCLYRFEETGEEEGRILGTLQKENELLHTQKLLAAGLY